jgi:hypothetical protein
VSKPQWTATRPVGADGAPDPDYRLCAGCGWRSVHKADAPWCGVCRERAREMGGPKEAPTPLRVPPSDHPSVKRRGYSPAQQAWIDSVLPVTCAACGAGGHVSADCPGRADRAAP